MKNNSSLSNVSSGRQVVPVLTKTADDYIVGVRFVTRTNSARISVELSNLI